MGPLNGGTPGLKDRFVRETEDTIRKLVEKQEFMRAELDGLVEQEEEARAMLRFLKTGKEGEPDVKKPIRKKRREVVGKEDFIAAIDMASEESDQFTATQVAELLGNDDSKPASARLSRMAREKDYVRLTKESVVLPGGVGRSPAYYRKLKPPT